MLADYHFLLIAPGLGAEWLFDTARAYFDRYRPTIIGDLNYLQYVPGTFTMAVTAIVRRDAVENMGVQIGRLRPDALYDAIVRDTPAEVRQVLDERAALNQPFGVPLSFVPVDVTLLPTIQPPRPPTQRVEGWVRVTPTQPATPTPSVDPAATAAPTEDAPRNPIPPITPTPGSLIGG